MVEPAMYLFLDDVVQALICSTQLEPYPFSTRHHDGLLLAPRRWTRQLHRAGSDFFKVHLAMC